MSHRSRRSDTLMSEICIFPSYSKFSSAWLCVSDFSFYFLIHGTKKRHERRSSDLLDSCSFTIRLASLRLRMVIACKFVVVIVVRVAIVDSFGAEATICTVSCSY